jgi:hypothetical protein
MGSEKASEAPIACTLDAGDFKQRLASIAELNRDALRSHERDGLVMHLRYDAKFADRVNEMVRRETQCCAFLRFDTRQEGDEVLLTITSPEEARVASETLFEQFASRGQSGAGTPARIALACTCAAVICAVACVAPLAVPAVVLAGTGTALAWLAGAHTWMTMLATLAVAAAWLWVWRHAIRTGLRPAPSTLRLMGVASFLLALALAWPLIEPEIARAFGA